MALDPAMMRWVVAAVAGALAAVALLAGGCAGPSREGPTETLAAFRRALEHDDLGGAYALMSERYRATTSRAEFERWLRSDPARIPTILANLKAARPEDTALRATVPTGAVTEVELVHDPASGWLVGEGALDLYDQRTPREALRSFVRALEGRRWEALLRFVPDAYLPHMTAAALEADLGHDPARVDKLVAALKESIDNEIVLSVDRRTAKMRYGMFEVDFVKEGEVWKIEDPD